MPIDVFDTWWASLSVSLLVRRPRPYLEDSDFAAHIVRKRKRKKKRKTEKEEEEEEEEKEESCASLYVMGGVIARRNHFIRYV